MAVDSAGKKRPRADLLLSLDAAFASASQTPASKYTVQAAAQIAAKGNKQQAYQHSKRKRRDGKRGNGNGNGGAGAGQAREKTEDRGKDSGATGTPAADPLYEKLSVDLLAVGLKDCSLRSNTKTLANLREMRSTFKRYLETITQGTSVGSTAVDQLKNKVMSLDNPIKTPSAGGAAGTGQAIAAASLAQTSKLLGARRRRQLGLHLLKGEMKYSNAEELQTIWMRYVRQVIDNELSVVEAVTKDAQRARNAKLQTKLKLMDLSGCPLEVVQSRHPCNVGLRGIVVAETQQVLQICCPAPTTGGDGPIRTLAKDGLRFRVRLDATRSLLLDSEWLAARSR